MASKHQLLHDLYQKKIQDIALNEVVSSPLLVHPECKNMSTDIMFVGQEANGFYGTWDNFIERGVVAQMDIYKQFMEDEYPTMNNLFFQ